MGLRKLLRARLRAQAPKAQTQFEMPLNLQLLFEQPIGLSANGLALMLRKLHPSLAQARVEIRTGETGMGMGQMARVQWGRHTVLATCLNTPMPTHGMEQAIDPAFYDLELKAQARAHVAHAMLMYRGEEKSPLEQYRALALIAAALIPLGAVVVANASAYASCPVQYLTPLPGEKDIEDALRSLPLLALFVGFVKMEVEGMKGIWMRTCGAPLLNLPDLAVHASGNDESQQVFLLFKGIFNALLDPKFKIRFNVGDLVEDEICPGLIWRFRAPEPSEGFLDSPKLFVLEQQLT